MALPEKNRLPSGKIKDMVALRPICRGFLSIRVQSMPGPARIAVIVPVRFASKATLRNSIRRRITECLSGKIKLLKDGFGAIVMPTSGKVVDSTSLEADVVALLDKSGMLK